jgi:histidyl-tRNA synthetase
MIWRGFLCEKMHNWIKLPKPERVVKLVKLIIMEGEYENDNSIRKRNSRFLSGTDGIAQLAIFKNGYQEYDGPFIEKIDLYAAKSGEELVKEQAFVFSDRGGDLITLRPELTLSLARMVAQKQGELVFPLRWWSFGPFWRYERPQKGRTREFFQWNIDLIGGNSPEADAELIAICALFFKETGLSPDKVKIKVNDRRIMDTILSGLG